ncbi:hypothetical protein FOB80_07850 [Aerococcus viridans]|nr:hypothetical protein FOB80_07850 [Aerococcus viridans]
MPLPTLEDVKLRDVPIEVYGEYKDQLPEHFRKRATHFYTEQSRVLKGAKAWAKGVTEEFGQLMFESGYSPFYQQETGIEEMKTIFDILKNEEGVYGARPSGAGFRRAVIGLVDSAYKESIQASIVAIYPVEYVEIKDKYEVNFCIAKDGARFVEAEELI